jgi:uncharacterized protein YlxW (UPF0749 family)
MKAHILVSLCMTAALSTAAIAATKPKQGDLADLTKAIEQLQSEVKALQDTVAKLASSQGAGAAQLQDVSRRLYATCVLTQRLMESSCRAAGARMHCATTKASRPPALT